MTPKEKAIELVSKFSIVGLQQRNEGIACALICVDEIINCDSFFETLKQGKKFNQYWHEVQDEIEKL